MVLYSGAVVVMSVNYTVYVEYLFLSSVKHNPHSGNLRTLVKRCLELATNLRDESQCERLVVMARLKA